MGTAGTRNDARLGVAHDNTSSVEDVDVEVAAVTLTVPAGRIGRTRTIILRCTLAVAIVAVVAVVIAVYHAMEANKIGGTTGAVTTISVVDNVRASSFAPHGLCSIHLRRASGFVYWPSDVARVVCVRACVTSVVRLCRPPLPLTPTLRPTSSTVRWTWTLWPTCTTQATST